MLASLASLLGGCFLSPRALITPSDADYPWHDGHGEQYAWDGGAWQSRGRVALRREGVDYVLVPEDGDEVTRFRAKQIAPDAYVVQGEDDSDPNARAYIFGLALAEDGAIDLYSFDAESMHCRLPGIDATGLGLAPDEEGCAVPSLDALLDLFRRLRATRPAPETRYILSS